MKAEEAAAVFNALGQKSRLKIFKLMTKAGEQGLTPTQIIESLGEMPRNTLSFHLNALAQAGLCVSERLGRQIIYKAKDKTFKKPSNSCKRMRKPNKIFSLKPLPFPLRAGKNVLYHLQTKGDMLQ